MITGGDEALRPRDEELAVGQALRRGLQGAYVAPRARLGKAHRPGPLPGVEFVHIFFLLFLRAEVLHEAAGPQGKPGIEQEGDVGGSKHLREARGDRNGHVLTAHLRRLHRCQPPACAILLEDFKKALRDPHLAILVNMAPLPICFGVSGQDDVHRHFLRLALHHQHYIPGIVGIQIFRKEILDPDLFEKDKLLIPQTHQSVTHRCLLFFAFSESGPIRLPAEALQKRPGGKACFSGVVYCVMKTPQHSERKSHTDRRSPKDIEVCPCCQELFASPSLDGSGRQQGGDDDGQGEKDQDAHGEPSD